MASTTPNLAIPYPTASDKISGYPAVAQQAAQIVDERITAIETAAVVKMAVTTFTYTGSLASNISGTATAAHGFGERPDAIIAQVQSNARLVVVVKSWTDTTVSLEVFNPSPSASTSPCTIQLISLKTVAE